MEVSKCFKFYDYRKIIVFYKIKMSNIEFIILIINLLMLLLEVHEIS